MKQLQQIERVSRCWFLSRIFNRLNTRYFENRLVKGTPIFLTNLNPKMKVKCNWKKRYGKVEYDCVIQRLGKRNYKEYRVPYMIVLDNHLDTMQLKLTMFHEMNHLYLSTIGHHRVKHGPLFQKGMIRLAKLGAFKKVW
jgi:hypothetical protein